MPLVPTTRLLVISTPAFAAPLSCPPRSYRGLTGRHNALKIVGSVARRYEVRALVYEGSAIVSAEVAEEPTEALRLPLPRDVAQSWLLLHYEGLAPERVRTVLDEITRPVGPLANLA